MLSSQRIATLILLSFFALPATSETPTAPYVPASQHDGSHDFDFELGTYNTHLKRLAHRLAGSTEWVEFDGTSVTQKIWDGRSQIEQFEATSATGPIEGLTLRLYNPGTHLWSLYWANAKTGKLDPPQIGQFKNGRGEFYATDMQEGKSVLIRFLWTNTTTDTPHFEQSFSVDGGQTWEVNWMTDQTRIPAESIPVHPKPVIPEQVSNHDFDFNFGTWHTRIQRTPNPFSGSSASTEMNGTVTVRKLWDGRAQLEQIDAEGASGHLQGLTLFLFNPQSQQWSQTFASINSGTLEVPSIGEFKNGRGELYDQEMYNGRAVFVRGVWSDIKPDSHHFEISMSADGGKTWKSSFIASLTRVEP
jgi:hypothetical protein